MILRKVTRFFILGLVIGFSSCDTTYYYYPTNQNVLRFKEKGSANISHGIDQNGFSTYNLGYSITDNIAFITDYKTFTGGSGTNIKHNIDDYLWDNELVIYKKVDNYFYPAINFGYGFGQIDRNEESFKLNIFRQFVQPSFGFSNKFFDIAISTRLARVHHNLTKLKEVDPNQSLSFEDYFELKDVGKKDFYFLEPAITLGVGYKFVKLRYQKMMLSKLSLGKIKYIDNNYSLSLNFTFNINKLLTKNKK